MREYRLPPLVSLGYYNNFVLHIILPLCAIGQSVKRQTVRINPITNHVSPFPDTAYQ